MRVHASFRGFVLLVLFALPVAGSQWAISGPDGGTVRRLVFDPADPSIVYAGASNGLFRSADGGRHWVGVLLGMNVGDVAVAKSDPRYVFAASPYGLYKSSDRGESWNLVDDDGSFHLAVSALSSEIVYNVSIGGPVRSIDGGVTFGSRGSGLPSGVAAAIAIDPQDASVAYVAFPSSAGVYKTTDGGGHWAQANNGLTASQVFSLAVDPGDGATLYAGGESTIFKSTDGAASWMPLTIGFGGSSCAGLEVSPGSPSSILAATSRGALMSMDAGASWSRGAGIADVSTAAVAVDPTNAATFLSAIPDHVYRTDDGGATSVLSESGLTSFDTRSIAVDPHDDAVVYAAGPAGLARSADHGRTWSLSTSVQPTLLAVDANASTLYAVSGTIRRSIDGGQTWSVFDAGLPAGVPAFFLAADPQLSATVYTVLNGAVYKKIGEDPWISRSDGLGDSIDFVTIDPHASSTVYAGGPPGVFKSSNGAATWAPANVGLTGGNAIGLAVDPFDSGHLFAWSPTQVFESFDGAAHWSLRPDAGLRGAIVFDSSISGAAYANTFMDVLRSVDGGKTWHALATGQPKSHSLFAIGIGGTPYLADSSGGVYVYRFLRRRAVGWH